MMRFNSYNEGSFSRLLPVFRQDVVPGQSVELSGSVAFETPAFLQNVMTGGMANVYAFYVPYRLVWDDWVEFASDPNAGLVIPTTATQFPELFETPQSGYQATVLARRAYKLIFNQFFGSQQFGVWYDDLTADTDVALKPLRTTDQAIGRYMLQEDTPDLSYDAPVTGTAPNQVASIPLNRFREQLNAAQSQRRQAMTGDKYVDAMRRMGVNLDWRVQLAPEFIGMQEKDFGPKETKATYGTDPETQVVLGRSVAKYQETVGFRFGRKFFAEHGIVIACLAVRPHSFNVTAMGPVSAYVKDRPSLFWGDNNAGTTDIPARILGGPGIPDQFVRTSKFAQYYTGNNITGRRSVTTSPWVVVDTPTNSAEMVYPTLEVPIDTGATTSQLVVYGRIKSAGPTPIKRNLF